MLEETQCVQHLFMFTGPLNAWQGSIWFLCALNNQIFYFKEEETRDVKFTPYQKKKKRDSPKLQDEL